MQLERSLSDLAICHSLRREPPVSAWLTDSMVLFSFLNSGYGERLCMFKKTRWLAPGVWTTHAELRGARRL
jgi:hypothetical protein